MNDFLGCDPDQMMGLSAEIQALSSTIKGATETVLHSITELVSGGGWVGPDAEAFSAQSTTDYQNERVTNQLDMLAKAVELHAEEQLHASSV